MKRRKTRQVRIGNVKIGGSAPVSVQSMTKTDTKNIKATVKEIKALEKLGCEIIRVAVKDTASAGAIKEIKSKINIPLVADIHFNYKLALESVNSGCDAIRINPGNIKKKEHILKVISACKGRKIPVRIGLNSGSARLPKASGQAGGSLTAQGLIGLARKYCKIFEAQNFYDIIISLKASDVPATITAYRKMAKICSYPFHIGVTATGSGTDSIIKSAVGIGTLLAEGIGDTMRVSFTGEPAREVEAAKAILQSLGLRKFHPDIIACPTCGRCQVNLRKIVHDFSNAIRSTQYTIPKKLSRIALMGCEVNGPGEAKEADIGIAFGKNSGILFKNGRIIKKIKAKDTIKELTELL